MQPLISCLTVTRKRIDLLSRAVNCFIHQSYPNKELIILFEDDDTETETFVKALKNQSQIRPIKVKYNSNQTLGDLRNISIKEAKGQYVCQWDDDDWYHNDRITFQWNQINKYKKKASILMNWLMFDGVRKNAYISQIRPWEGSIMCERESLLNNNIWYPSLKRGEDMSFIHDLINREYIFPLVSPELYLYTYSGRNTWDESHFDELFGRAYRLSDHHSTEFDKILNSDYTNDQSSEILSSPTILASIPYFHE